MVTAIFTPLHPNSKDLTGLVVGRWTVLGYVGKSYWLCRCECGAEKRVFTGNLSAKKTFSCGCFRDERASDRNGTHRLTGTPEYKVWAGMKRRCLNKNEKAYPRYGGKGITVCQRWSDSFEAFLEDMGNRPSPKHEIDRIDNSKGYEPGNCRWATRLVQARNKTSNRRVEFNGETHTLSEWQQITGIDQGTIGFRLSAGWDTERALTTPAVLGRNQTGVH